MARGALLANRVLVMPDSVFGGFVDTLARYDPLLITPVHRALRTNRPDRAVALMDRLRVRQGPGIPDYRPEWGRLLAAQGRYRVLDSAVQARVFPMETIPRWLLVVPRLVAAGDSTLASGAAAFLQRFIPPDSATAMFERMPVWLNGWHVGAYHAAYEDTVVARRWQGAIGALPSGGTTLDYRGSIQADIESRLLARQGDQQGALEAASRAFELWGIHTENVPEIHPEPQIRFSYAMLLLQTGRADSAAKLLRSLVPPVTWMGSLTARAWLELGRVAEARGDRAAALRFDTSAYRLWRTGDAAVASWRQSAREGIQRITGEPIGG